MSPSYLIVLYVSGHGFGHTSRTIEVIHALLRARPDAAIVVKTSAPRRLFERTLHGRIDLVELQCDTGMVQVDSLNIDAGESIRCAVEFQRRLPQLARAEAEFLRSHAATIVVGDIPPLAFVAAAEAGIPSVAIGNFTWDWIYQDHPGAGAQALAHDIRQAYRTATRILRLPMSGGFEGVTSILQDIPFIARKSRRDADDVRQIVGLPPRSEGKPLVLMSFGGYGVSGLDTSRLATLKDYTIATTDTPAREHTIRPAAGVHYISEQDLYGRGLRYEDLIHAADVAVTKPGYGIISEAIANDTALLYTSRGHFVEYEVLVREMPRYLRTEFIAPKDLLAGNWGEALKRLLAKPLPPEKPAVNGADVAAAEILQISDSRF
jgi:L-arabinokinase